MSWVANELVCDGERFYMECVREPPEWFLWWASEQDILWYWYNGYSDYWYKMVSVGLIPLASKFLNQGSNSVSMFPAGFGAVRKRWMITKRQFGSSAFATKTALDSKRGLSKSCYRTNQNNTCVKINSTILHFHLLLRSWSGAVIPLSVSRW